VKLGAENRTKLILAVVLAVVALVLGARFVGSLGGWSSSAAAPVSPSVASATPETLAPRSTRKGRNTVKKPANVRSLDPTLRFDLLKSSEDTKYEGAGRNIFRAFVEPPPKLVAPVVKNQPQIPAGPPPTPPPPPIDLKFYGFAVSKPGEAKRIFLIKGEDVFIAIEGDIVDRRYKVVRISANSVEILDVLSNNRQSIPLSQG
jgi:hypothetical protein